MAFLQELLLEDKSHCLLPVVGNEGGGGVKGDHIGCFQGDRKETSRRQQSIDEGWGRGL